jgi:hypothetical protein
VDLETRASILNCLGHFFRAVALYVLGDAMNNKQDREALLLKVLRKSPVLSMYHTTNGFDVDGFISAYEMWRRSVRETLEHYDASPLNSPH